MTKTSILVLLIVGALTTVFVHQAAIGQTSEPEATELLIGAASISEAVQNGIPFNEAVVFSAARKKLYCYTDFIAVPEKTFIYHNWYFRDEKQASIKLQLNKPRWATFSYVAFKQEDLGPWRVEVTDAHGTLLHTLRFSIVD
jgi:hypothetical protein